VDYQKYVRQEPERLSVTADGDAIARFCAAVGDRHDAHAAAPGATAPPTFAFCLAMAGGAFPFPTDGLIHAEQGFTFDRPVHAGEALVLERALTRARQRGEGEGAMWILTWEAGATTPEGAKAFAMTSRLVARPGLAESAAAAAAAPGVAAGLPGLPLRGQELVLDRERIAAYADASGDHNPIHLSEAAARRYGLRGIIAHGMLSMAIVATLAEDWAAAEGGQLEALTARFVAPVLAGERVVALGQGQGEREAALSLWSLAGEEKVRVTARRTAPGAG
jgi:acyl dehydratase